MCDEWYAHKKRKLLKELNSGRAETFDIMVGNIPKFNLMDFISLMLFIDTRIHNNLFNVKKSNVDAQIKDAINALSYIPLTTSKIADIFVFQSRRLIADAIIEFLEAVVASTEYFSIKSAITKVEGSHEGYS